MCKGIFFMKKAVILIILAIILSFTYGGCNLEDAIEGGTIIFYVKENISLEYAQSAISGMGYRVEVPAEYAEDARKRLTGILGESIEITGDISKAEKALKKLRARELYREKIDGILFINAYSGLLRGGVVVEGQKINLQIAVKDEGKLIIGTPLIIGSC